MLKIRLKRTGRKNKSLFRVVLMENLSKRDGKSFIELGYYNPITKQIHINNITLHKYINHGAYPTNTVRHLILKIINKIKNKE